MNSIRGRHAAIGMRRNTSKARALSGCLMPLPARQKTWTQSPVTADSGGTCDDTCLTGPRGSGRSLARLAVDYAQRWPGDFL